ncbi:sugar ABC transporter permease [Microbacterium schleiferi]|uniref:Sugar ABC transporter permease n=1 Tax=Microbacterium schleiferi TaxID=69362 RepID=A0A7S8MVW3_9MICO|nr:sugar ABC transporter permease [Microbacterium schleiferi]QPE03460.1 sugar ABC transporter permease [Microbacterium schleiferi]
MTTVDTSRARGHEPPKRRRAREAFSPYAFLAPTVAVLAIGFLVPAVEVVRRSFFEGSIVEDGDFVGLQTYSELLTSGSFWRTVTITLVFALGTVLGGLAVGLSVALLLNRTFRGRAVVRMLLIVPWALPIVPAVLVWRWALDAQFGIVNQLLRLVGLTAENIAWLNDPAWALTVVIVIQVWRTFPFAAIFLLAGLQNIPRERYEAAALDGAGWWQQLRHITLPGLRTVTAVLALLMTVWALGADITVIFLATRGGPAGATTVLSLDAYMQAFERYDFGQAAALGTIVLLLSTIPAWLYLRSRKVKDV